MLLAICLTHCYFHRTVCKQNNIWGNLMVSQYFRPVVKMCSKPRKTFFYSKMTVVVLISHFRGMFIVIFRRLNCSEEQQFINWWFFSWFRAEIHCWNEIDIFSNTPKTEFLNFSIDSPVQCCPEKACFK